MTPTPGCRVEFRPGRENGPTPEKSARGSATACVPLRINYRDQPSRPARSGQAPAIIQEVRLINLGAGG